MERKISYAFRTQAGEIELYDENLNKISTDDVLQAWHTYYIVIYHEDATEKIQYDLDIYLDDINTPQVDDYGDSFEEATEINIPISVGSGRFKIEGRIDYSGDKDFFRFIPEAEGRLKSVKNTEIGQRQLYDENQNRIPDDEVLKPGHIYYIVLESNFVGKVEYCTIKFKLISAILYGDVNRDQRVNSTDLTLMKRELLGVDISNMMFDYDAADIDGNGKFNSTDYAWLQRYLLDQVDVFPRDINGDGYIND